MIIDQVDKLIDERETKGVQNNNNKQFMNSNREKIHKVQWTQ